MSLETCYGPELNIFEPSSGHAKRLVTYSPILSYKKLDWILKNKIFKVKTFDLEYAENSSISDAIDKLILNVSSAIDRGATIIHLNEAIPSKNKLSLNALMATGALHQALIEQRKRTKVNIIVSTGSARDTHQIACLIAFGATSVYPWLAYQTILDLSHKTELKGDPFENCAKYRKGINKGLLKIISKLGISVISSYRGSQLFEIVGLSNEVVDKCFTNTDSRIGGKKFRNLENENRNISLFAKSNISDVSVGGLLKFIHGGELLDRYFFARLSDHAADRSHEPFFKVVKKVSDARSERKRLSKCLRFSVDVVPFCRLRASPFPIAHIFYERLGGIASNACIRALFEPHSFLAGCGHRPMARTARRIAWGHTRVGRKRCNNQMQKQETLAREKRESIF